MLDNNLNYTTDEIAEKLCRLAEGYNRKPDEQTINETEYALFQIKAMAENPYNSDYYRTLYRVLEEIAKKQ